MLQLPFIVLFQKHGIAPTILINPND